MTDSNDVTIEVKMPEIPDIGLCVNSDCSTIMFHISPNRVCPGCWEPLRFKVLDLKYTLQRKD